MSAAELFIVSWRFLHTKRHRFAFTVLNYSTPVIYVCNFVWVQNWMNSSIVTLYIYLSRFFSIKIRTKSECVFRKALCARTGWCNEIFLNILYSTQTRPTSISAVFIRNAETKIWFCNVNWNNVRFMCTNRIFWLYNGFVEKQKFVIVC